RGMLDGQLGNPRINSGFVDVRDLADLHVRAMTHEAASGERFIAIAGESMWLADVALLLKARMGPAGRRVSTRVLPNWLVRLGALRDPALRGSLPLLGRNLNATGQK